LWWGKGGYLKYTVTLHHFASDFHPVHIARMSGANNNNTWGSLISDEELYAIAEAAENAEVYDGHESSSSQHYQLTQQSRSYNIILEEYQEVLQIIEDCFSSQPTCEVEWQMYDDAWTKLNNLEIELQQAQVAMYQ
jgi:hypothetical protein